MNIIEFGLDDIEASSILPLNGKERRLMQSFPQSTEMMDFLLEYIRGIQVVDVMFDWFGNKNSMSGQCYDHHCPVQVFVKIANPKLDTSPPTLVIDGFQHIYGQTLHKPNKPTRVDFEIYIFDSQALLDRFVGVDYLPDHFEFLDQARYIFRLEIEEKRKELNRIITESMENGPIREKFNLWYEFQVREIFHKALEPFSNLTCEMMHRFVDEFSVKTILEE